MKTSMAKNGLILAACALVTTGLISLTFVGTKTKIAAQEQQKLLADLSSVMPGNLYDNDIQHDCALATNAELLGSADATHVYRARINGQPTALAIETIAPDGYSGKIKLLVGVKENGIIAGVRVLKHNETPGLGDKIDIRISDWILTFDEQSYSDEYDDKWKVRKDGGQFDQFTGATITPRAVIKAVKKAVVFYQQNFQAMFSKENACAVDQAEEIQ
jgi:electron transport complex protein RnfG